jgi:hypothetical protein
MPICLVVLLSPTARSCLNNCQCSMRLHPDRMVCAIRRISSPQRPRTSSSATSRHFPFNPSNSGHSKESAASLRLVISTTIRRADCEVLIPFLRGCPALSPRSNPLAVPRPRSDKCYALSTISGLASVGTATSRILRKFSVCLLDLNASSAFATARGTAGNGSRCKWRPGRFTPCRVPRGKTGNTAFRQSKLAVTQSLFARWSILREAARRRPDPRWLFSALSGVPRGGI